MRKLGAAFNQIVDEERGAVYADALKDIPAGQLDHAFEKCLKTCKFFPTIAEIREVADNSKAEFALASERAWKHLEWVRKNFYITPDSAIQPICASTQPTDDRCEAREFRGGYLLYPKPFDAATDHAIANVGGLYRIASLAFEEHDFVRRDFLAAHKYHAETRGLLAPSRYEAAQIFGEIQKALKEAQQ